MFSLKVTIKYLLNGFCDHISRDLSEMLNNTIKVKRVIGTFTFCREILQLLLLLAGELNKPDDRHFHNLLQ